MLSNFDLTKCYVMLIIMNTIKHYYVLGSSAICGFSKAIETWDAKVYTIYPEKHRDMLMGEKFGFFCWASITGPVVMPLKVLDWMNRIDIYFKGHKPEDYGYKKHKGIHEYLWS